MIWEGGGPNMEGKGEAVGTKGLSPSEDELQSVG